MNGILCLLAIAAMIGIPVVIVLLLRTKKARQMGAILLIFALYLCWFYYPISNLKAQYQLERVLTVSPVSEIETMDLEAATEIAFSALSEYKWQRSAWSSLLGSREFVSGPCTVIYLCGSEEIAYSDCDTLRLNGEKEIDRFIDRQGIVYFPVKEK